MHFGCNPFGCKELVVMDDHLLLEMMLVQPERNENYLLDCLDKCKGIKIGCNIPLPPKNLSMHTCVYAMIKFDA